MPGSSPEGKYEAVKMLQDTKKDFARVLDIGAGSGTWTRYLKAAHPFLPWVTKAKFGAVEIFRPYAERYSYETLYDWSYFVDIRKELFYSDLFIFGDVLEHMEMEEAYDVVRNRCHFQYALISLPIGEYPQEGTEENPHEAHVATWHVRDIDALGYPLAGQYVGPGGIGVFLLKGDRA